MVCIKVKLYPVCVNIELLPLSGGYYRYRIEISNTGLEPNDGLN